MSEYNAYGEFYDQRPQLKIQSRLRNLGSTQKLVKLASQENWNVSFFQGGMRKDVEIQFFDQKPVSETLRGAFRYFEE